MSNELFWLIVWWAGWFSILLVWYGNNKKHTISKLELFFMFVMAGLIPIFSFVFAVRKALEKKTK